MPQDATVKNFRNEAQGALNIGHKFVNKYVIPYLLDKCGTEHQQTRCKSGVLVAQIKIEQVMDQIFCT